MSKLAKARLGGCIAAVLVIFLDQLTKYFAIQYLYPIGYADFVPGILNFQWVTNKGAAWGQFAENKWILLGLTGVMVVGLVIISFTKVIEDPVLCVLFLLFAGGGLGNLIDRLRFGYVVDFLEFSFFEFPVFNLADMVISCSAVFCLIYVCFFLNKAELKRAAEKAAAEESEKADEPALSE